MVKTMKFLQQLRISWKNFGMAVLGCLLFAVGMNIFLVPQNFYNGGVMGLAQLLRSFSGFDVSFAAETGVDTAGIIYFILNVPLLTLAYMRLGKTFFYRTITMTVILTALMSIIKVWPVKLFQDPLTAVIVAGIVTGLGNGLVLSGGFCAGGQDILGLYFTKTRANFSVGRLSLLFNGLVFGIMALTHNFEILVYSLLFTAVQSLVTDRFHIQNITVTLMIFTKMAGVDQAILDSFGRGVTNWEGIGAYTKEGTRIHYTVINKYELNYVVRLVRRLDPNAFIVISEDSRVVGNFEKRL